MEGRLTLSASLLTVQIEHRVGALALEVTFQLTQPWTVLFGPSGSGKTTVLRAIAGFVKPDAGRIAYGTQVLVDRTSGIFISPHARPVRSAGQTALLFPHMTVEENVLFGSVLRSEHAEEQKIVSEVMAMFRIEGLAKRRPRELSGGERERVSGARALVSATTLQGPQKALVLLDEPFAGLDAAVRDRLLIDLKAWVLRWGIPVLSVTHDVGEAFQLEAEVIRISSGRVVAQGPVAVVLAEERSRLIAQLKG
jgi:molybdate transport system ATP-binding protein